MRSRPLKALVVLGLMTVRHRVQQRVENRVFQVEWARVDNQVVSTFEILFLKFKHSKFQTFFSISIA